MHAGGAIGAVALVGVLAACSSDDPPYHPGAGGGGAGASGSSAVSSSVGITTGSTGGGGTLPETFTVNGVVTDGQMPLAGAMVLQGGALEPAMITGADGAFSIELSTTIPGQPTVVAARLGYRADGEEFFEVPAGPVELALREVMAPDNPSYLYGEPGVGDPVLDDNTALCGHCHTTMVAQFQGSAHARSAKDPLLQDLYAGVSRAHDDAASCAAAGGEWRAGIEPGAPGRAADKCYLGGGVLPDLNPGCGAPGELACDDPALPAAEAPVAFGTCADCHAPAIEGKAGGRDLHEASGNAFDNGNHCDFCHHVREVDLDAAPGNAGRLVVQRPNDTADGQPGGKLLQVMFGPIPDVPNGFMGGSVQPQFSTSVLCAGCHQQEQAALLPGSSLDPARWPDGLPVHSTYQEWKESPFDAPTTQCQACHMPPDESGLFGSVDVLVPEDASIASGFVRPPSRIRQHVFLGPLAGSPRLIDGAVQLFVSPVAGPSGIEVAVTLYNGLAGHAVPTGEPMRALLLLVRAEACGEPLAATGGMTLHDVGGALAEGEVGAGVSAAGATLAWAEGAARAQPGDVVRAVRPTGAFDDYPGIGFFADPALGPEDKGMPRREPVGQATVVSVAGGVITLDAALAPIEGTACCSARRWPAHRWTARRRARWPAPRAELARVLVDPAGERLVPHYRAVDMASDNRLAPQIEQVTAHTFALPPACDAAQVSATLVYRPVPLHLAALRGWEARDWVIAEASESVALP
ncbi:MAG: carboxypeptidase-like regulatory domain-containing protein [Polyangiaceae bacterium]